MTLLIVGDEIFDSDAPVNISVENWPRRRKRAAVRIAREMGYTAYIQPSGIRGYPRLVIHNEGKDLERYWKNLDKEAPLRFKEE